MMNSHEESTTHAFERSIGGSGYRGRSSQRTNINKQQQPQYDEDGIRLADKVKQGILKRK
jgi:hypothetical protein